MGKGVQGTRDSAGHTERRPGSWKEDRLLWVSPPGDGAGKATPRPGTTRGEAPMLAVEQRGAGDRALREVEGGGAAGGAGWAAWPLGSGPRPSAPGVPEQENNSTRPVPFKADQKKAPRTSPFPAGLQRGSRTGTRLGHGAPSPGQFRGKPVDVRSLVRAGKHVAGRGTSVGVSEDILWASAHFQGQVSG